MSDDDRSCPTCGARVPAGATRCDLCGTEVEAPDAASSSEEASSGEASSEAEDAPEATAGTEDDSAPEEAASAGAEDTSPAPEEEMGDSVYCNQCGFENPLGANYCSQCGTELQDLSAAGTRSVTADLPEGASSDGDSDDASETEAASTETQAALGTQIAWMVGGGVTLVLVFFFATQWSQQYEWGDETTDASGPATTQSATDSQGEAAPRSGPAVGGGEGSRAAASASPSADLESLVDELGGSVEGPVAGRIDSLRALVDNASGQEKRQLQSQLVQLYVGAGTPGRAALLQRTIADATGSAEDHRRAADLLYRWMRQVEQDGDRAKVASVAQHVAAAYETVAEQRSQDLDARTRMGEAYLLTNNPMKGIRAINAVLEDDSTFVPARFQKGLALLQINRLDQAVKQFEMVKTHASKDEPFYQQAQRAIEVIQEQSSKQTTGSPSESR